MTKFGLLKYSFLLFTSVSAVLIAWSLTAKRRLGAYAVGAIVLILSGIVFFVDIYWIEPNWIEIERVKIRDNALAQILHGTKIVQVSDIHLRRGIGFRERELITKINSLQPDILFITGDIVDAKEQIPEAVRLISSFKAKLGIWGVPGNTDHLSFKGKTLASLLEQAGIRILINDAVEIPIRKNQTLWVAGVDDPDDPSDKLEKAMTAVPPGVPVILLTHKPGIFDRAAEKNINLVLAGHTHGGQVGIPFLVQLSRYANRGFYVRGLYKKKKSKLYINRGIGMKTLPIRFLCRPEITLFEVWG